MTETAKTEAETFVPRQWDTTTQSAPAPYIPTFHGLRHDQYKKALESFGERRDTGEPTNGTGHGDRVTVITDPFTGNVGYVTQWTWDSRVEWGMWTPNGFEQRGKSDVHTWMWDAVETVRHILTCAAFRTAHLNGELVGYWAQAQDREAATAAYDEWLAQRSATFAHLYR